MKKLALAGAALVVLAGLAAAAFLAHLVRQLDTPEFQKSLLAQARATVGADVRVREMDISLLSGVTLRGLAVANPAPFSGDFLTAKAFVLRYRLLPLLAGRFEVERLALEKPTLGLVANARGTYNYEKLGSGAARDARPTATPAAAVVPLRIVLKQLAVDDGSFVMTDEAKARLVTAEGIGFRSAFEVEGAVAQGNGKATIATVNLADLLFVRGARSPIALSKESVRLAPIRGTVAGGEATGDVTVRLKGGFRYVANLEVKGAQVRTLLAEAKAARVLSGTLQGKAVFEGTGGMATLRGHGQGTVEDCRVERAPALALLAAVLQVPELATPDFDECRVEFTQAGRRLSTPVLRLVGPALRLSGKGTVDLETDACDYDMTLALAPRLFAKLTRPEVRSAFRDGGDGFSAIDFHLYGTTLDPKTDLLSRLGKAAATQATKDAVNRLLKRKIF